MASCVIIGTLPSEQDLPKSLPNGRGPRSERSASTQQVKRICERGVLSYPRDTAEAQPSYSLSQKIPHTSRTLQDAMFLKMTVCT